MLMSMIEEIISRQKTMEGIKDFRGSETKLFSYARIYGGNVQRL